MCGLGSETLLLLGCQVKIRVKLRCLFCCCLSSQVSELRDALEERGLDTKGTKPFLVERLREALAAEAGGGGGGDPVEDGGEAGEEAPQEEDEAGYMVSIY
jgi:hypothetical protein